MNGLSPWQLAADDALPIVPKKTIGNLSFGAFTIFASVYSNPCLQVDIGRFSPVQRK